MGKCLIRIEYSGSLNALQTVNNASQNSHVKNAMMDFSLKNRNAIKNQKKMRQAKVKKCRFHPRFKKRRL